MRRTATTAACLVALQTLALGGCKKPCKEGPADAAWQAEPLSKLTSINGGVVCEGSTADSITIWKPSRVHDANMEAVGKAQDNGWDRNRDNWYPKPGSPPTKDFDSPKWSELSGPAGKLRIDVHEEGGGALIAFKLSAGAPGDMPGAAGPRPRSQANVAPPPKDDSNVVYKVAVGDSPVRGPADALVTMVVFSDFQCPFCARIEPTLQQLMQDYPGKVRVVWKHRPLAMHARAVPAANLAIEAGKQQGVEGFWKAHDLLFKNIRALQDADLEKYATELGLDAAKAKTAFTTNAYAQVIAVDEGVANSLSVVGTPQVFVNGRRVKGAQPLPKFKAIVEEELAKADALVKAGTPAAGVYDALQAKATAP